jgi:hypothetical protein
VRLFQIVFLPVNALHAPTLAQTIRAYDWWETGAPRARALAHALRACDWWPLKRQSIHWQEFFWIFVKRYMALSRSRVPFERGSKSVRKTILTDSRFPGTTELLSAPQLELKGVRANLEEQVRIKFPRKKDARLRRERRDFSLRSEGGHTFFFRRTSIFVPTDIRFSMDIRVYEAPGQENEHAKAARHPPLRLPALSRRRYCAGALSPRPVNE